MLPTALIQAVSVAPPVDDCRPSAPSSSRSLPPDSHPFAADFTPTGHTTPPVKLHRISQDGVRVRANAGAASFRREQTLQDCIEAAKQQVQHTKRLIDQDDPTRTDKTKESAARAALEREKRVRKAMHEPQSLEARKAAKTRRSSRVPRRPIPSRA